MGAQHGKLLHGSTGGGILVLGSTGYVGKATVEALVEAKAENVFAGMRNVDKAKDAGFKEPVKVVQVDPGNEEEVCKIVKDNHIKRVYVIPPGHIKRTEIAVSAIRGAKRGGAHFVALLSVLSLPFKGTCFADQFKPAEDELMKSFAHYTILRFPLFIDNVFLHQQNVKEEGKFYGFLPAGKKNSAVATADGGKASAEVLMNPTKYNKKIFDVVSDVYSSEELAKALSEATGKKVEYVVVPEASVKEAILSKGLPEWQVDGIIELYKLIDANLDTMKTRGDLDKLGVTPTRMSDYTKAVGEMFK